MGTFVNKGVNVSLKELAYSSSIKLCASRPLLAFSVFKGKPPTLYTCACMNEYAQPASDKSWGVKPGNKASAV